ncbi:MAG: MmcQ/YjbR family DNA-binding protein [Candidatus Avilachnospira sp.]
MNREELGTYISDTYGVEPDMPWADEPSYEVFRHVNNRKWFAVIMDIPRNRLGLPGDEMTDIVNLKCDPVILGSFLAEPGFFRAYHMNKENWITVALDGSADEEKLKFILDMSFELTASKLKRKK